MQPHHHRINHTPMYFNGLLNNCNFSKHKLMRSLMMVWLHRNMSELF